MPRRKLREHVRLLAMLQGGGQNPDNITSKLIESILLAKEHRNLYSALGNHWDQRILQASLKIQNLGVWWLSVTRVTGMLVACSIKALISILKSTISNGHHNLCMNYECIMRACLENVKTAGYWLWACSEPLFTNSKEDEVLDSAGPGFNGAGTADRRLNTYEIQSIVHTQPTDFNHATTNVWMGSLAK